MNIGKSKIVVFGGLVDKKFLNDIVVYDIGTFPFSLMTFGLLFSPIFYYSVFLVITKAEFSGSYLTFIMMDIFAV